MSSLALKSEPRAEQVRCTDDDKEVPFEVPVCFIWKRDLKKKSKKRARGKAVSTKSSSAAPRRQSKGAKASGSGKRAKTAASAPPAVRPNKRVAFTLPTQVTNPLESIKPALPVVPPPVASKPVPAPTANVTVKPEPVSDVEYGRDDHSRPRWRPVSPATAAAQSLVKAGMFMDGAGFTFAPIIHPGLQLSPDKVPYFFGAAATTTQLARLSASPVFMMGGMGSPLITLKREPSAGPEPFMCKPEPDALKYFDSPCPSGWQFRQEEDAHSGIVPMQGVDGCESIRSVRSPICIDLAADPEPLSDSMDLCLDLSADEDDADDHAGFHLSHDLPLVKAEPVDSHLPVHDVAEPSDSSADEEELTGNADLDATYQAYLDAFDSGLNPPLARKRSFDFGVHLDKTLSAAGNDGLASKRARSF